MDLVANYFFATLIGASAGAIELLRRYRDAPWATLREGAAFAYVVINAASSLVAYHLVVVFDVRFGVTDPAHLPAVQVLVAGLAAVTFFRTTLFTVRSGDTVLEIGPSAILQDYPAHGERRRWLTVALARRSPATQSRHDLYHDQRSAGGSGIECRPGPRAPRERFR